MYCKLSLSSFCSSYTRTTIVCVFLCEAGSVYRALYPTYRPRLLEAVG